MSDTFERCIKEIFEHEGKISNNKFDRGGITSYGISLNFLIAEKIDVNFDGLINHNDILYLTKDQAKQIYKKYWWDRWKYNLLKDYENQEKVLDISIHFGSGAAHQMLQKAINKFMPPKEDLKVDGILGPKTFAAANKLGPILRNSLRCQCADRFDEILSKDKSQEEFRDGWMLRAMW